MYLYLTHESIPGFEANDYRNWSALSLMPAARGRVVKNHTKISVLGIDFCVAVLDAASVPDELARNPEKLKEAVKTGEQKLSEETPEARVCLRILMGALRKMLEEMPEEYYKTLPRGMAEQLRQINAKLTSGLDDIERADHDAYYREPVQTITVNKKLINNVIAATPYGAGWSRCDVAGGREPFKSESDSYAEMTAAADNMADGKEYGFNKLATTAESETETTESVAGVFVPKPDETYIIDEQVAHLFKILQISRRNSPQNVRLVGPHGCGKTELAIQFAGRLGLPLLIMDCANLREARDWFGYKTAKDGTVYWHESQFVRAVAAGNHVILLDELNRANPHLLNTLMPLLDARRFTYLEEKGDKIAVGPGTVFFASMNEGAGYTGTSALDRAIRDRFPRIIEMTYLGESDEINLLVRRVGVSEDIATRLVQMANKIRQDATGMSATLTESMSTRQLLAAAHDFAVGGVDTLTFTISNHFSPDGDDDSERVRVQNIIQGKFGDLIAARAAHAVQKGA